ncbi:tyrosine-type recombinase/integrase [Ancylobacter dichloromethanicus]|uniref:Integrase n=2 Tax=Ancylobacter dichloromethanicus TaxID=518825 RepID=A0A9W6J8A8_9HYPH|nr:site-specific integrase [Ancylobacter dichloromethanicus]GLK71676.1 integrase [Ancylobacter dichloromethanicus]
MSVYKRADSPFYHYDFQRRGVRFSGSTGETSRRAAEEVERAEKERVRAAFARGATTSSRMSIDDAAGRYWHEVGQHTTNAVDLDRELAELVRTIGPSTSLADITDEKLAGWVARRRGEYRFGDPRRGVVSPATVNRGFTQILRRIFQRARKVWKVVLPDEPDWASHILAEPRERVRELRFDEEISIEAVERDDYRPVRLFAQASGLRRREVVSLTWPQVDWASGVIRVVGKGDKPHVIPITREITNLLWPLRGHHRVHVFTFVAQRTRTCAKSGNRYVRGKRYPVTYWGWGSRFARDRVKADLTDLKIHDLRHTSATRTLRASKNLKAVQNLLGHSDIKTTMRYAHALTEDVAEAMNARVTDEAERREMHVRRTESRENPELGKKSARKALRSKRKLD